MQQYKLVLLSVRFLKLGDVFVSHHLHHFHFPQNHLFVLLVRIVLEFLNRH